MQTLNKTSLLSKLLLLLFVGFMLLILTSTLLVRGYLQEEYRQIYYAQNQQILVGLVDHFEAGLKYQEMSLSALAETMITDQGLRNEQELELILKAGLASKHFDNYMLMDSQGIALVDVPIYPARRGTDYSDRPFIAQVIEDNVVVRSPPFMGRRTQVPLIAFNVPVMQGNQLLGILTATHELLRNTSVAGIKQSLSSLKEAELYIVDNRNNLYVTSDDEAQILQPASGQNSGLVNAVLQQSNSYGLQQDAAGKTWVYTKASLPFMDWTVIHLVPEKRLLAPAEQLMQQYLYMQLLMLIVFGLMILLMVKLMLQPIRRAIAQLNTAVASDQKYQPLDSEAQGEIGQLLAAFNRLQAWRDHKERLADELVSIVSHELRTPLTSIQGSLRLLTAEGTHLDTKHKKQLLDLAQRNSERLAYLVDDLLDMAAIKSGHLEVQLQPCQLFPLLEEAANNLACSLHSRQQQLINLWPEKDLLVKADPQRFLQVLGNLLTNASKFSPQQSEIRLDVTSSTHEVRIAVIDQGPGIQLEDQGRIFERFSQGDASARREQGGAGLGLAIAKELTEAMGGQLKVESNGQTGSCFYIYLLRA